MSQEKPGGGTGKINDEEAFVKVFKDGYSLMGCVADAMFTYADKFSTNKDKFGKDAGGVSIVHYKEMVDSADAKPMSPEVCYEFCRSVPDMVFFGITEGRACYCTPYWKPSAEGTGNCDQPCEGAPTEMCGGMTKSSIYEMHYCGDTGDAVSSFLLSSAKVLSFFYQNAQQLKRYDDGVLQSGKLVEAASSAGDDPAAAELGMAAGRASGAAAKLLMDGTCLQ